MGVAVGAAGLPPSWETEGVQFEPKPTTMKAVVKV